MIIDNVKITGNCTDEQEARNYIKYVQDKTGRKLESLDIVLIGDEAELKYEMEHQPFERIRRITGYLTGDVGGWNNAKSAELKDRVKHSVEEEAE